VNERTPFGFSSGTFSKVHVGRRPLPLYHYLSTAIKVRLLYLRGYTPCESSMKCGIHGVSALMFWEGEIF